MNVSISTDDPLMFHFTDEPLLEEYSVAAHTWKLSPVDLCELARNSVLQSGYEDEFKRHWLGQDYKLGGRRGNNMRQTNVSNIRLQYREDALREELSYMHDVLALRMALSRPLPLPAAPAGCFSLPASTAPSAVSGDFSAAEDTGAHLSQVSLSKKPSPVFSAFSDGGSFKHCKTTEEGPQETPSFRPSLSLSAPTHLVIPQGAFGGERPGDQTQEQRSLGGAGWVNAPAASTPASPCSSPSSPLAHSVSQTLVKGGVKSHQLRAEGGGRGSGGEGGAGIRPLRREAAMKKLLEVAEESAGMEFGDFAGRCTKSPLLRPHSESVDILNGPSREVLQTLGACSHLSKSSDTLAVPSSSSSSNTFLGTESDAGGNSTGGNALAAGTSCNHKGHSGFGPSRSSPQLSACPSSSLPFYTSYAGATLQPAVSTAAESPGVGSEGKGESSGSGVTSPEETGGGGGGVGMLRILTSPLIHEHLSHASSVIVGDYAKSTAEEHDGDEEEQIGETCERGEGGVGGDPCTVGFRGFRLHHATLGGLQNGTEEELRRIEQKTWNESSPWEGGINCVDGDEDGVLDTE
ncbi:amp deaminase [Cystoisospora suis]|uniref:AMP deaminase n=1 Tax=Cystoisospora suis TaxID=483139 RepID=A0A2C6LE52_9APIC|nr:amp deaminase [Cystoisospora suis]